MFAYLLQGLTLGFSAGVSPGPLQAFFMSQTLKNGWKRTLPAAFAPLISDGPIILLVLVLLTRITPNLLSALQIVGGGFILYLAWGAYQTFRSPLDQTVESASSAVQSLRDATVMNLLNPNPYIFWSTILGPILIEGWRESPALGLSFVLGFYLTMIGTFMAFIYLFGTTRHLGPKITRALSGISALALLIFGIYQIGNGIGKIWA